MKKVCILLLLGIAVSVGSAADHVGTCDANAARSDCGKWAAGSETETALSRRRTDFCRLSGHKRSGVRVQGMLLVT